MAEIAVQNLPSAGVATDDTSTITYTAATDGGESADLKTQGGHFLRVVNDSGSDVDVTITSQQTCQLDNTTPADTVVTVTASKIFDILLIPLEMVGLSDLDWRVNWSVSLKTSVTYAVLKV